MKILHENYKYLSKNNTLVYNERTASLHECAFSAFVFDDKSIPVTFIFSTKTINAVSVASPTFS